MIRSTIKIDDRFGQVSARVDKLARECVDAAARAAAPVAQAGSSIDLELELIPAQGDLDGYSAGIKSRKQTRTEGRTTPIAIFFDKGTLGGRKTKLRPRTQRKESWEVKRGDNPYVAHRHSIDPDKGIPAERFFLKARAAGRKALLARIQRGA